MHRRVRLTWVQTPAHQKTLGKLWNVSELSFPTGKIGMMTAFAGWSEDYDPSTVSSTEYQVFNK